MLVPINSSSIKVFLCKISIIIGKMGSASDPGIAQYASKITDHDATGFQYFEKVVYENNFLRSEFVLVKPLNPITSGPILVPIGHAQSNYMVPLDEMEVQLKCRVVKEDGTTLAAGENNDASLINFSGQSLFENINGKLCSRNFTDHHRLHQHKTGLINTYSFGHGAKSYNLSVERYKTEKDTTSTAVDSACPNFVDKQTLVNLSGVFFMNFTPLIDLANGTNFLCPTHELLLEFERGKSSHVILRKAAKTTNYKVEILDFQIQIKKLFMTPQFEARLLKKMQSSDVNYNFTRNVLRTFAVHEGVTQIDWNNLFIGRLPTSLYFVFLDNEQIASEAGVNPHTWLRYDCTRAHLIVNGHTFPTHSITYNETTGDLYNGYRWFLSNIGLRNSNEDVEINIEKYYKDKFMIPFDLSHRSDSGFIPQIDASGTITFHCEFKQATTKALTLMVLASFESHLAVTKDRDIVMDYVI